MNFADWFSRLALAIVISTSICVPAGLVLLRISGAPPDYAPLLPQQVFAGTFGGSILVAVGYALLAALIKDKHTRFVSSIWRIVLLGIRPALVMPVAIS